MNHSEPRISKELAPEVFAIASRLYAEQNETYSVSELIKIGAEANIPPEYIHQALKQIKAQQRQTRKRSELLKNGAIAAGIGIALLGWVTMNPLVGFGCHGMMSQGENRTTQLR